MTTIRAALSRWFLSAPPLRAVIETLALGCVLLFSLMFTGDINPGVLQNSVFIVVLSAVSLFALRMRWFAGNRRGAFAREVLIGGGLALALSLGLLWLALRVYTVIIVEPGPGLMGIVTYVLALDPALEAAQGTAEISAGLQFAVLVSCGIAYVTVRSLTRLWVFWQRLQRQHLIWAITNSHLMLVLLGAFVAASFIVLTTIWRYSPEEIASFQVINTLVPLAVVTLVMMLIILVVVLPPSILLAYLAARLTTRRIKTLAAATAALRGGDYTTRLTVEGEDEVASLQSNFNGMADALQQAMTDLQAERDAVAQLLESRRELMASVSHELRTPVAILSGQLEGMQARLATTPPEALAHDVTIMVQETERLQRLLDDLFTLARAEVSRLELHRQHMDVRDVITHVVDATAPVYWQTQRVEVIADVQSALAPVLVDRIRLEQILHNLIRNGVRHTPPGGIVALLACNGNGHVQIQVKDTGEGIAPDDLPHIWERFYRAENARQQDSRGSGLGLALVKDLVEAMDGTITVDSQPGQGSCFTIRLPAA